MKTLSVFRSILSLLIIAFGCSGAPTTPGQGPVVTLGPETLIFRLKQEEAKQLLKQIYTMEQAYRQQYGSYWPSGLTPFAASKGAPNAFSRIGIEVSPAARYTYVICVATPVNFQCLAEADSLDDDATPDVWTINEIGSLACLTDDAIN